jgi:hypothetical protein
MTAADRDKARMILDAYERRHGILHSSEVFALLAILRRMIEEPEQLRLEIA